METQLLIVKGFNLAIIYLFFIIKLISRSWFCFDLVVIDFAFSVFAVSAAHSSTAFIHNETYERKNNQGIQASITPSILPSPNVNAGKEKKSKLPLQSVHFDKI